MSKKGSKNTKEAGQYSIGDTVLGKIRGYPPWPGVVVDPTDVPASVLNEQPPGKKSQFHCVMFFPAAEYAWLNPKDMSTLKQHEIDAFLADDAKKRNGELRSGYTIARDPRDFLQRLQRDRAEALAAEEDEDAANEDDDEVDELEGSEEGSKKKARKRKRDSEDEPARTKKSAKEKATAGKKPKAAGKGKKKSKTTIESEDDGEHEEDSDGRPGKKSSPPPTKRSKREKEEDGDDAKGDPQSVMVRDWRHKLQKTFLSSKTVPKADAMGEIDQLFTTVEEYHEMTIEQLQFSKIGKVMRHIAALSEDKIPKDDEYAFRTRAKDLVERWHQILNANKPAGTPAAQTNGKAEKGDEEVAEGTKNLDLNGTGVSPSALAADSSILADVTMSEA